MAAMMAEELAAKAVFDKRGGAIGTIHAVAAGAANGDGRVTPAIEKEQGLIACCQCCGDVFNQRSGKPRAGFKRNFAHINEIDLRKFRAAVPVVQFHMAIAATIRIDDGFKRRRGRREDNGKFSDEPIEHFIRGVIVTPASCFRRSLNSSSTK